MLLSPSAKIALLLALFYGALPSSEARKRRRMLKSSKKGAFATTMGNGDIIGVGKSSDSLDGQSFTVIDGQQLVVQGGQNYIVQDGDFLPVVNGGQGVAGDQTYFITSGKGSSKLYAVQGQGGTQYVVAGKSKGKGKLYVIPNPAVTAPGKPDQTVWTFGEKKTNFKIH